MRRFRSPRWTAGSKRRCAAARCGTRSRTSSMPPASASPAASSSGFALRAPSRGGPRQGFFFARPGGVGPGVILFDEPCSALDPISTAKVEELIQELAEDYTIAIVTHNMQQAARVSDKTAFMYLGDLIEFDDTNKIFTSPSDRRTQDYITGRFG